MASQDIAAVFKEIFTNPLTLARGKEFLDNYALNKPNFLLEATKLFILSKETVRFRKNVGVLLNVLLQDHWDSKDIKFNFQKQKKVYIYIHHFGLFFFFFLGGVGYFVNFFIFCLIYGPKLIISSGNQRNPSSWYTNKCWRAENHPDDRKFIFP